MTSSPNEANERRPASNHWRRRGLLAGVATLVAGAVARASAKVAEAADGQAVVLGSPNNAAASPTVVNRNPGNGVTPAAAFGAIGGTGLTGIFGTGYLHGVDGGTNDTSGHYSGVAGTGFIAGRNAQIAAGVHGSSDRHPGVIGDSDDDTGVYGIAAGTGPNLGVGGVVGTSTSKVGVLGTSNTETGVLGISAGLGPGLGPRAGVAGTSSDKYGVLGTSTSNHGVLGISTNAFGVLGNSTNGVALGGNSNYIGLFGQGNGNAFGVQGQSDSGIGIYAISNGATGTGLYATSANGYAARFQGTVLISGTLSQTGGAKSALVPHPDGQHRRVYCQESPEPWFEDFGEARLRGGRAMVQLDEEFDAVVRGDNYRVFLTPEGDCNGLYVSSKGPHRFEVRELKGGTSELTFSYRVVARRRDIEGPRLEKVRLPEHQPARTAPPMNLAPTSQAAGSTDPRR